MDVQPSIYFFTTSAFKNYLYFHFVIIMLSFFFKIYLFLRERERQRASREVQREREIQNLKQVPVSELLAQSLMWGSNPWAVRSWHEPESETQAIEPPRHPHPPFFSSNFNFITDFAFMKYVKSKMFMKHLVVTERLSWLRDFSSGHGFIVLRIEPHLACCTDSVLSLSLSLSLNINK